jgi:hypothetical protein
MKWMKQNNLTKQNNFTAFCKTVETDEMDETKQFNKTK